MDKKKPYITFDLKGNKPKIKRQQRRQPSQKGIKILSSQGWNVLPSPKRPSK